MLELNNYYKLVEKKPLLDEVVEAVVYYHLNEETKEVGFGFNFADGGGFIPFKELAPQVKIHPVVVLDDKKLMQKKINAIAKDADNIASFAFMNKWIKLMKQLKNLAQMNLLKM